jgi:hypothetical protein
MVKESGEKGGWGQGRPGLPRGGVVDGAGDFGDDLLANGVGGGGIGDEDGDGEAAAIGQGDEADVIGGIEGGAVLAGGSGLAGDDGSGRKESAEAPIAGGGGGHPAEQELGVRGGKGRRTGKAKEQSDQGVRLRVVAVLELHVAVDVAFVIANMNAVEDEAAHVLLGGGGSANGAEQDVGGDIIAVDDGAAEEFLDRHVDGAAGVLVAQRAVAGGSDELRGNEVEGLGEGEAAGFDGVQDGDGDGQLVDGHHGEQLGGIEAAVEGLAGQGAGDADAAMSLGGDADDSIVQRARSRGMGGKRERAGSEQDEQEPGGVKRAAREHLVQIVKEGQVEYSGLQPRDGRVHPN